MTKYKSSKVPKYKLSDKVNVGDEFYVIYLDYMVYIRYQKDDTIFKARGVDKNFDDEKYTNFVETILKSYERKINN